MKAVIIIATLLSMLAIINAMPAEKSSDILRKYNFLSTRNLALKEDTDPDFEDGDEEPLAALMKEANFLDTGDEKHSLMAAMMENDEEQAVAQFNLIRDFIKKNLSTVNRYWLVRIGWRRAIRKFIDGRRN